MSARLAVSKRTIATLVGGVVATIAVYAGIFAFARAGNDYLSKVTSDVGEVLIVLASALVVLSVALRYGKGENVRRYWLLIGTGMMFFVAGDVLWTFYEVVQKVDPPYPGLPDLFYGTEYVLLAAGMIAAVLSYRHVVSLRGPLIFATAASVALFALLYVLFLNGLTSDVTVPLGERLLSTFYPFGDVFLEVAPAIAVLLIAWRLGRGRLGWPWVLVAVGLIVVAMSDSGYSLLEAKELYASGSITDAGWMLGNVLIAGGASLARDVFGV